MPLPSLNFQSTPSGSIRSAEIAVLDQALEPLREDPSAPSAAVYLEGPSGVGKSFIVEYWYQAHVKRQQQQPQHNKTSVLQATGTTPVPTADTNGFIPLVRGKFNQVEEYAPPYSAILQAVLQLCQAVDAAQLCDRVLRHLGEDGVQVLVNCAPNLGKVLQRSSIMVEKTTPELAQDGACSQPHGSERMSEPSTSTNGDFQPRSGSSLDRFSFLFCEFLYIITTLVPTFIMLIDDVQWADDHSRELLRIVVTDPSLTGFLIVFTAWSAPLSPAPTLSSSGDGEQPGRQSLSRYQSAKTLTIKVSDGGAGGGTDDNDKPFVVQLQEWMQSTGKALHYMPVNNLTVDQINAIVSSATELNPSTTMSLSEIVMDKTKGNTWFVLQFLYLLERRQLLQYSLSEFRWTWQEHEIRTKTDLADNVATIVTERVGLLSAEAQWVLRLASFLGHSFQVTDLSYVVEGMELLQEVSGIVSATSHVIVPHPQHIAEIQALLEEPVQAGLLDRQSDTSYKFAHDSIQQSFLSLASDRDGSSSVQFHLRIGSILICLYRLVTPAWALFAGVHVLNRAIDGLPTDEPCVLGLARLNLEAAESAYRSSGFFPASEYVRAGIALLNTSREVWTHQYKLALTLHLRAAVMGLTCGDHEQCQAAAQMILTHGKSLDDRIQAYLALANSLRVQSKYDEAKSLLITALEGLGETFPKRFIQVKLSLSALSSKRMLGKMSDDNIVALPRITNRRDRTVMRFLSMLYVNAYYQQDQMTIMIVTQRMIALTLKLGLCKYSPLVFAACALRSEADRNLIDGHRYGVLAHKIIQKLNVKENVALVYFLLAAFVEHLKKPLYRSLFALERGWQTGMEAGDVESAFLCATTIVTVRSMVAYPLGDLAKLAEKYFRLARSYGQNSRAPEFLLNWQYAVNLAGLSADPLVFDGTHMGEEGTMQAAVSPGSRMRNFSIVLRGYAAMFMGQWELALRWFEEGGKKIDRKRMMTTHYYISLKAIPVGITYYKEYARTKDPRLLSQARRIQAILADQVRHGAINVVAGLMFVEAQQRATMYEKLEDVKPHFDRAILALHKSGVHHWEALACENFAQYARDHGDRDYAAQYIRRAHDLYRAWGAFAKTKTLQNAYADLLDDINQASPDLVADDLRFALDGPPESFRATWWN